MTKQNKARLVELYLSDNRERYPSLPDYARYVYAYKENGANALTRCVIDWINFSGGQAERISTTGRPIDKTQTSTDVIGRQRTIGSIEWIPGTGTKGSADISSTIKPKWSEYGVSVKWEVKWRKDRQSEYQKKYEVKIQNAGGFYFVISDFDSFVLIYDDFINNAPM